MPFISKAEVVLATGSVRRDLAVNKEDRVVYGVFVSELRERSIRDVVVMSSIMNQVSKPINTKTPKNNTIFKNYI